MLPMRNAQITFTFKSPPPPGVKYAKGYHSGIDMISGDKLIYAPVAGTIIERGYDPPGWGNFVILRSQGHDLIFAHLASFYVVRGQNVAAGDKLGVMGATGQVLGAHLHFEVRKSPWQNRNDVDPAKFLRIENKKGPVKGVEKKVDNLVIYADGDTGTALILSQKLGCPMVHKNSVDKYQAVKKHWIGVSGSNDNGNYYYAGANRLETAKAALK